MIAVLFEVQIKEGAQSEYLREAARLAEELQNAEGFISIERFRSLSTESKLLSLSYWENEESVAAWRTLESHRQAQQLGREVIFMDYTIRVAEVTRSYGMTDRASAPADSRKLYG